MTTNLHLFVWEEPLIYLLLCAHDNSFSDSSSLFFHKWQKAGVPLISLLSVALTSHYQVKCKKSCFIQSYCFTD